MFKKKTEIEKFKGLGAFAACGYLVNTIDLTPQHAAILIGISSTFGHIPGVVSPLLTGIIVTDQTVRKVIRIRKIFC